MKGGLEKKMLGEHLSVSCVPIIQRAVVPVPILQPGWKPLQSFPSRLFFAPALTWSGWLDFFNSQSEICDSFTIHPFSSLRKATFHSMFSHRHWIQSKTSLIEKEFLCKNWILQKYWNEIEIFCSSMCSSLVPGASLCYKTKPTT